MIDCDSHAGSLAKALADIQAMRDANKAILGNPDERKIDTDNLRKEHPLYIRRQHSSGPS